MRTFFTFLFALYSSLIIAQNPLFVHTADAGNIVSDASYLDHPDLNGNPNAQLIVSHNWNPNGIGGTFNDKATGLFYDSGNEQWGVYNEDASAMIEESSYNIYIGEGPEMFEHIATSENVIDNYFTVLDHPILNGNPDANLTISTYYNPNSLRNEERYGVFYYLTFEKWAIYAESLLPIPLNSAFFVAIDGEGVQNYIHQATSANITENFTVIDHPLLNGEEEALFVFTHNWGEAGDSSNVIVDFELGAWYTGTNWSIFIEDGSSPFLENSEYNLLIYNPALSTEDDTIKGLSYYPNPVSNFININAINEIDFVSVYDMQGRLVLEQSGELNTMSLNASKLPTGNYLAEVKSGNNVQVIKIIKQ